MRTKREFGDYQTPEQFALEVCRYLKDVRKLQPEVIIEPTCGVGGFVKASLMFAAKKVVGIEINPDYCRQCCKGISDPRVQIINADFFSFDLQGTLSELGSTAPLGHVLVLGNPPWVTNSELASLNSSNVPTKSNFKGAKGLEAMTGAGNFDICESIILKLVHALQGRHATIAMLCKTSVARNVFQELKRCQISFKSCDMYEFDARKVFNISASACLLIVELHKEAAAPEQCQVYAWSDPTTIKGTLGFVDGKFCNTTQLPKDNFFGECCFEWRQGIKHDCAKLMELTLDAKSVKLGDGAGTAAAAAAAAADDWLGAAGPVTFVNGHKDKLVLETDYIFPLVKSSMFKAPLIQSFSKYVIVTQRTLKAETSAIATKAPLTWQYLQANAAAFAQRKSSIYQGAPAFSMFGIGDYAFAKFKVGISGFYKTPLFAVLVGPHDKAVMVDDTCYFLSFETFDMAYTAMLLLNAERVQTFLTSAVPLDAKRPFTKKVLSHIDFGQILKTLSFSELQDTERRLKLAPFLQENMLQSFKELVTAKSTKVQQPLLLAL